MKKRVNVFGKEISVLLIVFIAMIGLTSAALIPYLSGVIVGTVTVSQPLTLEISETNDSWSPGPLPLSDVCGGEQIDFWIKATNNLDGELSTNLIVDITNSIEDATCEDFTNVKIVGTTNGEVTRTYWDDSLNETICDDTVSGTAKLLIPASYLKEEWEMYNIVADFAFNVAPATYNISIAGSST
ncbi:MAG: hypothetical protein U9Q06_01050 [Nanoarchaeota archaeon]|nr:hypothetical protein [Nanoarchaeota archaeon]